MPIPQYQQIYLPALQELKKHDELRLRDFQRPLSVYFELSQDDIAQMYSSGNGPVFYDRMSWALSYLKMAGLVIKPRWGFYKISQIGRDMSNHAPDEISHYVNEMIQGNQVNNDIEASDRNIRKTPEESLDNAFESIRTLIYTEIIDTVLSKSPRAFESLVVQLLQRMGYGGEIAAEVTTYTNDGGIDGIIKEDVLGLGRIHIQAKRYAKDNQVGREEIQKFVGALAGVQSIKGIFITTSGYSKRAINYASQLNSGTTLVLINGAQLAQYIYDYGLGMQVEKIIEIKRMDGDFWDAMEDDA